MRDENMISVAELERVARTAILDLIECTTAEWGERNSVTIASVVLMFEKTAVNDYVELYMDLVKPLGVDLEDGTYVHSPTAQLLMTTTRAVISDSIIKFLDRLQENLRGLT